MVKLVKYNDNFHQYQFEYITVKHNHVEASTQTNSDSDFDVSTAVYSQPIRVNVGVFDIWAYILQLLCGPKINKQAYIKIIELIGLKYLTNDNNSVGIGQWLYDVLSQMLPVDSDSDFLSRIVNLRNILLFYPDKYVSKTLDKLQFNRYYQYYYNVSFYNLLGFTQSKWLLCPYVYVCGQKYPKLDELALYWKYFRTHNSLAVIKYGLIQDDKDYRSILNSQQLANYTKMKIEDIFLRFLRFDTIDRQDEYYAMQFIYANGYEVHLSRIPNKHKTNVEFTEFMKSKSMSLYINEYHITFGRAKPIQKYIKSACTCTYTCDFDWGHVFVCIAGFPHDSDLEYAKHYGYKIIHPCSKTNNELNCAETPSEHK
jgi:hypothetical protein